MRRMQHLLLTLLMLAGTEALCCSCPEQPGIRTIQNPKNIDNRHYMPEENRPPYGSRMIIGQIKGLKKGPKDFKLDVFVFDATDPKQPTKKNMSQSWPLAGPKASSAAACNCNVYNPALEKLKVGEYNIFYMSNGVIDLTNGILRWEASGDQSFANTKEYMKALPAKIDFAYAKSVGAKDPKKGLWLLDAFVPKPQAGTAEMKTYNAALIDMLNRAGAPQAAAIVMKNSGGDATDSGKIALYHQYALNGVNSGEYKEKYYGVNDLAWKFSQEFETEPHDIMVQAWGWLATEPAFNNQKTNKPYKDLAEMSYEKIIRDYVLTISCPNGKEFLLPIKPVLISPKQRMMVCKKGDDYLLMYETLQPNIDPASPPGKSIIKVMGKAKASIRLDKDTTKGGLRTLEFNTESFDLSSDASKKFVVKCKGGNCSL